MPFKMRTKFPGGWAEYDAMSTVRVGDRVLPKLVEMTFMGGDSWPGVHLKIEIRNGVPVCSEASFVAGEGTEVRSKDLRSIPVEDMIEIAMALTASRVVSEDHGVVTSVVTSGEEAIREHMSAIRNVRRAARKVITDDLLRKVADVYRQNATDRPTKAVEVAFGVSARTAARYVDLAAKAGHLPETTQGKRRL